MSAAPREKKGFFPNLATGRALHVRPLCRDTHARTIRSLSVFLQKDLILAFCAAFCLAGCATVPNESILTARAANIDVGLNDAGQPCILDSAPGSPTGRVYCAQSRVPGARLARITEPGTLDAIAAAGRWRSQIDNTLTCQAAQPTRVLSQPGLMMTCVVKKSGLTRFLVLSEVNGVIWSAQSNTATLPVAKRSIAVLGGSLTPKLAARAGAGIAARRLAADDDAEYDQLVYAATRANRAGDFVGATDAYRRALALHRKLLGTSKSPLLVDDMTGLAIQVSAEGRQSEAHSLLRQADQLADNATTLQTPESHGNQARAQISYAKGLVALNEEKYREASQDLGAAAAIYGDVYKNLAGTENLPMESSGSASVRRIADRAASAANADDPLTATALSRLIDAERHEAVAWRRLGDIARSSAESEHVAQLTEAGLFAGTASNAVRANVYETEAFVASDLQDHKGAERNQALATTSFKTYDPDSFAAARSALALAARQLSGGRADEAARTCHETTQSLADADAGIDPDYILPCLDAIWATRAERGGNEPAARDMFETAQLAQATLISQQIAATALRLRQDSRVASLLKKLDDARQQRVKADADLDALIRDTPDARADAEARLAAAQKAVNVAEENVQSVQPGYAALVERVVSADVALGALRPGEALVSMLFGKAHGWVFLLRDGKVMASPTSAGLETISGLVGRVRKSLEIGGAEPPPFDTDAAYTLYKLVLGPVATEMNGAASLIVAPSGPLLAVPFAILLTKPVAPDNLISAAWLMRDFPIAHVPAPSSVVNLRAGAGAATGTKPYAGFGDFRGIPLAQARASFPPDTCGQSAQELASLGELRMTRYALGRVALEMKAGPEDQLIGPSFTADSILAQADTWKQARVLLFATHALLPTDLACEEEPSLVTNLPPNAANASGALLTESKISSLELAADLVILDGCNTGGGGLQRKAESLSGLARSFIGAGARSLLVTYWSGVDATDLLVSEFVQGDKDSQFRRPAEALAKAQIDFLALASGRNAYLQHPYWWGQLVFVGVDPGGARSSPQTALPDGKLRAG